MLPNDGIVYPVGSRLLSIFPFSLRFFTMKNFARTSKNGKIMGRTTTSTIDIHMTLRAFLCSSPNNSLHDVTRSSRMELQREN